MKLIVISDPVFLDREAEAVNNLFEAGLEIFHLRKPESNEKQIQAFLQNIKPGFIRRIMISDHVNLLSRYNFRGLHLSGFRLKKISAEEIKTISKNLRKKGLKLTTSVHSLDEARLLNSAFDNAYISPVFDSLSKPGYTQAFSINDLTVFLKEEKQIAQRLIALGGIDASKISVVKDIGFSTAAVLGYIWGTTNKSEPEEALKKYSSLINPEA